MVMNVASALNAYKQTAGATKTVGASALDGSGFSNALQDFMGSTIDTIKQGETAAAAGAAGKADMQSVVLAVEKASTMLETVIALRDKVVSAYQEIIRMQV